MTSRELNQAALAYGSAAATRATGAHDARLASLLAVAWLRGYMDAANEVRFAAGNLYDQANETQATIK